MIVSCRDKRTREFAATPQRVGLDAEDVMVWVAKRVDEGCKAFDSL
jgi:hypothetical protein